jgi:glycosyltransferase involved in cell wall biosynthesis
MRYQKRHIIWIAWEKHRRTSELAKALTKIKLFQFDFDAPKLVRYFVLLIKTSITLLKEKPDIVFVQNPSLVLTFYMLIVCKILSLIIVVDAHNEGIKPFSSTLNWLLPIYRLIQRYADLTIVTNHELAEEVAASGGTSFVLEDKIPEFHKPNLIPLKGKYNVVYICSFEKDEPYNEVIEAARLLNPDIYVYITGNYKKAPPDFLDNTPLNVIFCGYLLESDYINLLYSCDVIMDLTLMENCLTCGAYEAIALGKRLVLSDTKALRRYFHKGVTCTKNFADNIADALSKTLSKKDKSQKDIIDLKKELILDWQIKFRHLNSVMDQLTCNNLQKDR